MGVFLLSGISMFCNLYKKIYRANFPLPKLIVRILFENIFYLFGGYTERFVNEVRATHIVALNSNRIVLIDKAIHPKNGAGNLCHQQMQYVSKLRHP